MADIKNFVQENRRLEYRGLRQFAKEVPVDQFVKVVDHAVLVGSGIYSGMLQEHEQADQTFMFNKRFIEQDDDAQISLHSAIFYLGSLGAGALIKIGRAQSNDLVLDDNPISREHAQIRVSSGHYFITDFGGTNGTMLNEKQMAANTEVELQAGDTLGFGRYQFSFMTPDRFYKWIHKY